MDESYQHYVEKGRQTHIHVPVRVHIHTHHKFTNTTPSQRTGKENPARVALAGVAQWIVRWPANQRTAGWIPSEDTCLGCRADAQ